MDQKLTQDDLRSLTRGRVVEVDLGPKLGALKDNQAYIGNEIGGVRRCVIVQADIFSTWSTMVVVPITGLEGKGSNGEDRPISGVEVLIPKGMAGQTKNGAAQAHQVRTIDRNVRVKRILGIVPPETMTEIEKKLRLVLGMVPLDTTPTT